MNSPDESCVICGEARACRACLGGPRLRELADTREDYRRLFAELWAAQAARREARPATAAEIDPVIVAIDLCPHRKSCQCAEPIRCDLLGEPRLVTLAQCRACKSA